MTIFLTFLHLKVLIVLRSITGETFYRISFSLSLDDVFLMVEVKLWSEVEVKFLEEDHRDELPFSTQHIRGIGYQLDL